MSYGISILNEDGHTQVDENYRNFMLQNTGQITTENDPYGHGQFEVGGSWTLGFWNAETAPPMTFISGPAGEFINIQQTFFISEDDFWGYIVKSANEDINVDWWEYNYPGS